MHLVPRENLPEPTNADQKRKHKHDERTADHSQRAISPHRSDTASPNSTTTTGCCEGCTIL